MMSEPVDVVILGAVRHARTYAAHIATRADLRVVALAEEVCASEAMRETARRLADDLRVPLHDASRLEGAALALICSEPTRHARLVALALAQGINVLCDKPLATSADDLAVIEDAAQEADVWCAVVTRALAPAVQAARAIVESGRIGLPRSVDVEFLSDDAYLRENPDEISLILDASLSGGGELMNFLGYPIDVVRVITGCEPVDVYARAGALTLPAHVAAGVEDIGTASLAFSNGLMVSVLAGRVPVVPQPGNGTFTIRIIGSHGHLEFDADGPLIREFGRGGERIVRLDRSAVDAVFDDVVRVVRSGGRLRYDHRDAAVAVRTIEAAYRSVSSGRVESVAL
ncbi:Gfo/Idh/MocA family protein [Microbacterium sp. ZW T5_56]|uniref:Gfo/Idh/MocA family protein n=1 Tax=Microbacterium sp. ZW T5_56 TaxID=3378081 RepID=UPI003852D3F0